jgi:hypothetical protein
MTQSAEGDPPVEAPAQRGRWRAAWRWLTRPLFSGPTFSHRQTHLLAWLLVFMFGLATAALILVLVVDPAFSPSAVLRFTCFFNLGGFGAMGASRNTDRY